jgi:hypothetical protein
VSDPNKEYFEYKVTRLIICTVMGVIICAFSAFCVARYIDRMNGKTDNEYTVQLKYLEMGYIQRTCGECSKPGWFKVDAILTCPTDGKECK